MRRKMVSFPLSFCLLAAAYLDSTFRAVFGPVGAGGKQRPAYSALLRVQPVNQGRFQFPVQRQHRRSKPPAQQGAGNGLDADTFLPIASAIQFPPS